MRKLLKYTYLIKLIMTAFIAIYIPFLLLNSLAMRNSYREVKDNKNKNYSNNTYYFAKYFYDQIDSLINQTIRIEYERKFVREVVESHQYYIIQAIGTLSQYNRTINFADLCGIYFNDSDYLITSYAKYDMDYFVRFYSEGDSVLGEKIRKFITEKHANEVSMLPIVNVSKGMSTALLVGMPISTGLKGEQDAFVVYLINPDTLRKSFLGRPDSEESALYIFDSNNDLLYSNGIINEKTLHYTEFNGFLKDADKTLLNFKSNDVEYAAFKWHDKLKNMTFISVILYSEIEGPLLFFYKTLQRTLILFAVTMVIILGFTIYINYRPILKLSKCARKFGDEDKNTGEINSIGYMIEKVSNENNHMQETVLEQRMMLKERIYGDLLSGATISEAGENTLSSDLKEEYNNFFALSVRGIHLNNLQRGQLIHNIYLNCGAYVNLTDIPYDNCLVFICAVKENPGYRDLAAEIESLIKQLYDNGFHINIDVLAFLQHVKNGERDSALAVLSDIHEYILKNVTNVKKERYICYDILCSYLKTLEDANIKIEEQEAEDILNFNNVNEFCKIISNTVEGVCNTILLIKEDKDFAFKKSIVDFVDLNATDPDICLLQVADKFNISIYTLSRIFKESTGIGFKEYITSKRIGIGKHLLSTTDKSIFDIAKETGFSDTTQFTRVFKSLCGIAPSKYR